MNENKDSRSPDDESVDFELVAYLDGELEPDVCAEIENRLTRDPKYRVRLAQLQSTWDLLDELPHTEPSQSFTRSTLEMVTVKARRENSARNQRWYSTLVRVAALVVLPLASFVVANRLMYRYQQQPHREIVRDIDVIEKIDQLRIVDYDFLLRINEEGLFAEDLPDVR